MMNSNTETIPVTELRDEARQCHCCGEYIAVIRDEDGTWLACSCDQGYVCDDGDVIVYREDAE